MNSNLPSVWRFKGEDFDGAPEWFMQFLTQLNLFTNPVYSILNGGVNFQNLSTPRAFVKTITAGTPTMFEFQNPLKVPVSAVMLGGVYEVQKPKSHPSTACGIMWHPEDNNVVVDDVIGLTSGTTYILSVVVL